MANASDDPKVASARPTPILSRRGFLATTAAGGLSGDAGAVEAEPAPGGTAANARLFSFMGGKTGAWAVARVTAVIGAPLPLVERINIVNAPVAIVPGDAKWVLRGVTSNERYVTSAEKVKLVEKQVALGRAGATHGALIPIRKNAKWWALSQEERRTIIEDRSHHVQTGLKYLPAVARRLHHCRDLAENEPFDFLTLFDFAPADAAAFDELVAALRATEEWKYVDREVEIRLVRTKA